MNLLCGISQKAYLKDPSDNRDFDWTIGVPVDLMVVLTHFIPNTIPELFANF